MVKILPEGLQQSEAKCAEQDNACRQPIPSAEITCDQDNADQLCHGVCKLNALFHTPQDCCMETATLKGICCCGPYHISSTTASSPSPGQDGGDVVVVVPAAPGDAAPNDNFIVAAPNREDCYETAWVTEGTLCDDPNCRDICQSHTFGSEYDTCIESSQNTCCCSPICGRFLVSATTAGCNDAACATACLVQGFQAQHVNKCLKDRCCCHQQRAPPE